MVDQHRYSLEVVAPIFPVTDIHRAKAFYTERLAFEVAFEWADAEDAPLNYVILQTGNTELHLSLSTAPRKTTAYFFVNNVAAYYDWVRASGAEIAEALADQPWEMREFEVTDPDGNALIFGEHLSRIEAD